MTPQQKQQLLAQKELLLAQLAQVEYELIEEYVEARKAKGLKPNRINAGQLAMIIKHYFDNGCGMVSKSFQWYFANYYDVDSMEVDWAEKMANRSYGLDVLVDSLFYLQDYAPLKPLFESKVFNKKTLLSVNSLTAGIKHMDTIVAQELIIIEREQRIAELEALLAEKEAAQFKDDWKAHATHLLNQGMKQKDVAEKVGKSLPSIKKLSQSLKASV